MPKNIVITYKQNLNPNVDYHWKINIPSPIDHKARLTLRNFRRNIRKKWKLTVPATDFDGMKVFALNLDRPKSHT